MGISISLIPFELGLGHFTGCGWDLGLEGPLDLDKDDSTVNVGDFLDFIFLSVDGPALSVTMSGSGSSISGIGKQNRLLLRLQRVSR